MGAEGIMQIMPRTYQELLKKHSFIKGSVHEPKWAVAAGVAYNKDLWNMWKAKRPFLDRIFFTFGAYNCGPGNVIKAQKKAGNMNPNVWTTIEKTLPLVTGHHSKETIGYIKRIQLIKSQLKGGKGKFYVADIPDKEGKITKKVKTVSKPKKFYVSNGKVRVKLKVKTKPKKLKLFL